MIARLPVITKMSQTTKSCRRRRRATEVHLNRRLLTMKKIPKMTIAIVGAPPPPPTDLDRGLISGNIGTDKGIEVGGAKGIIALALHPPLPLTIPRPPSHRKKWRR